MTYFPDCRLVTDDGLAHISSLPNLECLTINYLKVSGNTLIDMPSLKKLECRGCLEISDEPLSELFQESHSLHLLDLSGCELITNDFIKAAIAATENRTNNVICEIYVGGTSVELEEIQEKSLFLKLLDEDLSEEFEENDDEKCLKQFFFGMFVAVIKDQILNNFFVYHGDNNNDEDMEEVEGENNEDNELENQDNAIEGDDDDEVNEVVDNKNIDNYSSGYEKENHKSNDQSIYQALD